ncbi:hypothetical protein N7527_007273 [Penicillium freii]|nr:hypothetical protein N7527_007273 [Penicillium freii]
MAMGLQIRESTSINPSDEMVEGAGDLPSDNRDHDHFERSNSPIFISSTPPSLSSSERPRILSSEGHSQLLAYMAMVQANQKKCGQSDWTVYGVLSDGEIFTFYRLEIDGQFTLVVLQALREGWQEIANMLASFILKGVKTCASHVPSSLASNPSARNSHRQSSPQLPPLDSLPSIEDIMDPEMKMYMYMLCFTT